MSWIASGRQQAILFGQEKVQWLKYHPWTKTWGQLLFKLINWSVLPKVQSKVFLVQCSEIKLMCITRCLPAVLNFFSWLKSWISWRTSRYPEWPFSIQAVITRTSPHENCPQNSAEISTETLIRIFQQEELLISSKH